MEARQASRPYIWSTERRGRARERERRRRGAQAGGRRGGRAADTACRDTEVERDSRSSGTHSESESTDSAREWPRTSKREQRERRGEWTVAVTSGEASEFARVVGASLPVRAPSMRVHVSRSPSYPWWPFQALCTSRGITPYLSDPQYTLTVGDACHVPRPSRTIP